ncbi:pyridoxamine 5'-phosphate oxidase family protein [Arenibacter sp. GZD96]|uniref:pyridoxamine 5'-phosphate oxidase family protein n=1 Tax=Aurantibrevibacter litoralis TaxID=3106030 RepID=UPI002AFF176B|nr:pyridoxamine 5'-phosphate oxidase family protein [Arenibacter sp. GZD-96]MEA1784989.1 pyridoxamine 5'-phosphate oxidase family protein [Arenibacter sp. GZD-96]
MQDQRLQEVKEALQQSLHQKTHPFRFMALGTVDAHNAPSLRTVVLRDISEHFNLIFYTDMRTEKIRHIKKNNKVSLLLYNPDTFLQLKIDGIAHIHNAMESHKAIWETMHANAKRDYTAALPPGAPLDTDTELTFLTDKNYFCSVEVAPYSIDYLKLQKPHHLRIRFTKTKEMWQSAIVVP